MWHWLRKIFAGNQEKCPLTPLFNYTELNLQHPVLDVGGFVSLLLSILRFAADGPSNKTVLPGYVSLFVHSEHGASKRRSQVVQLYDETRPSLMAYLSGLGLSVDEAEDIIQESFLRLVRHLANKREEENLRGWLFRVAHNLTMDQFRAGSRYIAKSVDEDDSPVLEIPDTALSPEEVAIKREELRRDDATLGPPA
jgi:hypothetical protein